jgi:hypothetical protein
MDKKNIDEPYINYMKALDECIALARKRALLYIEGSASASEMMRLDVQLIRANSACNRKRDAWVRVRDEMLRT